MTIARLAQEIGKIARTDGSHPSAVAALSVHRLSARSDPLPCFYELGLAVIAQGAKQVTLGEQVMSLGPGQSLLTTVDLPVLAQITRADLAEPFLGLMLKLDARNILQLAAQLPALPREQASGAVSLSPLDQPLLDAMVRLLQLQDEPQLRASLAPLIEQEILVRLLSSPHGPYLRQLVAAGSPSHQIAQAMAWLKQNFVHDVLMDELAERVHMSPSTFRLHFRNLAGMSPLQYQKQLRLQEARLLMLNQALDAGSTAARVGYESASQFSRDYSRLFGAPPQRDIQRMRRLPAGGA
ncbi:AraC family transcriptional regulator [Paucibacter sp. XJ19-41]|uniref:AraC family transcriptional regulator n=1 Tax=Paucibacter sp. XJ19-41 TaxID=2927824 RepID=UPI00234ACEA1|nr:AraC family transcriptional regulator [Paucibacter sp. XJ19-41]MDC6170443.1 AraC family transcriptional regulator [Paucibacter sp. XJ19-41]